MFVSLLAEAPLPKEEGPLLAGKMFVYRLACQPAKTYDAFRSYLNVFDDEMGEYFLLNTVMCFFIFENSIVDRT